jgi:hypothetical protein
MSEDYETLKPLNNGDNMEKQITQKTGRHVARCLDDLGNSISPSQQRTIKHWFWLLSDDIKLIQHGDNNNDNTEDTNYNR